MLPVKIQTHFGAFSVAHPECARAAILSEASPMRLLLIGGNGFIGLPLITELQRSGHELAVLHRRLEDVSLPTGVLQVQADRNRLQDYSSDLRQFSPDIVIDLVLSSGEQARQLVRVCRGVAGRIVALSSMDVYRAWGVLHGTEPGQLEPLPIHEDSSVRTVRQLYPPESVKVMRSTFSWVDENYDKIAVEQEIRKDPAIPATILRLPMVYGPGDRLHRFFPLLKRLADGRSTVVLREDIAAWRGPRGYVENIAHAIALAATSDRAAGQTYNVCDEPTVSELAWQTKIAQVIQWPAKFVTLPKERTPKHLWVPGNTAQHVVATSERIRNELGYREPVSLEESIRRTVAWEQLNPPATINSQQFDYEAEDSALANTA
jgi:nucleoside-diphosphate-sugar epimerase